MVVSKSSHDRSCSKKSAPKPRSTITISESALQWTRFDVCLRLLGIVNVYTYIWERPINSKSVRRQRRIDLKVFHLPVPKLSQNTTIWTFWLFFHPGLQTSGFGIWGFGGFWDLEIREFWWKQIPWVSPRCRGFGLPAVFCFRPNTFLEF